MPPLTPRPVLRIDAAPDRVQAVALVLHGGRSHSTRPVRASQLPVLRMRPFATALRRAGAGDGLAVARLRYAVRGWNGDQRAPLDDVRWALAELANRFPGVPVALIGHSMGGRSALYVAGDPAVRAVVALAPWIEQGDPVAQLAGRRVLIAHGLRDRMTSPQASAAYARDAAAVAASVGYVSVEREKHSLLRRARVWNELTTGFVLGALCDKPLDATMQRDTANVLRKALAGQASLVV